MESNSNYYKFPNKVVFSEVCRYDVHSVTIMMSRNGSSSNDNESVNQQGTTVRYPVYLNTNPRKNYNILKFSTSVDFSQWKDVKASRDLSMKKVMEYQKSQADEMPEFGAGSEFGKKAREEAWKRRRGINMKKKLSIKDMPLKLKVGQNKSYVGKKEGGVDQHSSYFIMSLTPGAPNPEGGSASVGNFQMIPVSAWFGATTVAAYKTLDEDEAEEEFSRRDKILNHFNLMLQKRLKDEQADDEEDQSSAIGKLNPSEMGLNSMKEASLSSGGSAFLKSLGAEKGGNSKVYYKNVLKTASSALKISDYDDDYMSSSGEEEEGGFDDDEASGGGKKKKKGKKGTGDDADEKPMVVGGKKKKKDGQSAVEGEEGDEVEEESDDGDVEGLEYDYNEAESSPSEGESEDENETVADDKKAVPVEMDNVIEEENELDQPEEDADASNDGHKGGEGSGKGADEDGRGGKNSGKGDAGKRKRGTANSSPNDSSDDDDDSDEDPDNVTSILFLASSKLGKEKSEGEGQSSSSGKTSADGSSKGANGTSAGNGSAAGPNLTEKQAKTAAVLSSAKVDTPSTSSGKRKARTDSPKESKRAKTESKSGDSLEELIKKYVKRKPTATGELLIKVKKSKPDLSSAELVKLLVDTMSNLGVKSKTLNGKTMWYMKEEK